MKAPKVYEQHSMMIDYTRVALRAEIDDVALTPAQEREIAATLNKQLDAMIADIMTTGRLRRTPVMRPFHDNACQCSDCRRVDAAHAAGGLASDMHP